MKSSQRLLDLLTPYKVPSLKMERWGGNYEGGYVLPAGLMSGVTVLLTGGVSDDVKFEKYVTQRNSNVRIGLFDHTISHAPLDTPRNAVWHKFGLGDAPSCISLEAATKLIHVNERDVLAVKLDIESAEWGLIDSTPVEFWEHVDLLILELHGLDQKEQYPFYAAMLEKINKNLLLIHVHGNNYAWTTQFRNEGVEVPNVIEATYINQRLVPSGTTPEIWNLSGPTPLDRPNNPEVIDMPLNYWLPPKNILVNLLQKMTLYVLPWRIRKNIILNLTPKKIRHERRAIAMRPKGLHAESGE